VKAAREARALGGPEKRPLDRTAPPLLEAPGPLVLPPPTRFTLACGADVVLAERHDLPLVAVELLAPGGASAVPASSAGLASLTADMLDEGAGSRSALELALELEGLGAALGSAAGYDDGHVTLVALRARFAEALTLMTDVVVRPTFDAEELERVRQERIDLSLQLSDQPRSLANDALGMALFGAAHPWGPPLLGTRASLAALTRAQVVGFHAEHYHAGNATFLVAGDVTEPELRDLLEARLAGWGAGAASRCTVPAAPAPDRTRVLIVDRPGSAQSEIRVGRVAVARSAPDFFPIVVLNTVLGGAFTSRLNAKLREEKGFTYGARSGFHTRCAPGPFVARAAVHTPVTDQAVAVFLEELDGLVRQPVPEEELERAKRYAALRLPQRFETVGDLVARMAEQALYDLPDDYWASYVPRLLAVDAAQVHAAARRHLDPSRMTVVVVGDRSVIERPLRALGMPVEVLPEETSW
jgi:zinc protease